MAVGAGVGTGAATATVLASTAHAAAMSDAELLVPLVGSERLALFGYQQALAAGVLSPRGERLAERILEQEQAHITAVTTALEGLGGTLPAPITSVSEADQILAARQIPGSLANLHSRHDTIILLARLEWLLEGAYITAVSKLQSPRLLRLAAQILANEAQHGTMLSELLHPGDVKKAVPWVFVVGTH